MDATETGAGTGAGADWGEPRTKTITWYDPLRTAVAGKSLAGVEHLRAIRDGVLAPPPMAAHFGFRIVEVANGDVSFVCQPDESAYNPIGLVHGGLVCTLLDSVLGCAVQSTLPPGVGYTSIELKVSYLRPVGSDGGELRARGWVTKPGRRVAFAEADVHDAQGKIVATASGTCLLMPSGG
ncbi:MAG TPA: PaaI family thioesterase [Jatrophihabitantaceae bacterium]|nr:PaaI family thioesterase [Jatrophihabitantaceae bacterium]